MGMCSIPGDPDLFGLGVRIGSYMQWVALIIMSARRPGKVVGRAKSIPKTVGS
jgi:hypothetical protein